MVVLARRPLVAAAGHPQALVDAVRLSVRLLLPLHHEGGGGCGGETYQGQQEAEQLQPRVGHRVRLGPVEASAGGQCEVWRKGGSEKLEDDDDDDEEEGKVCSK